jgi:hypothetical protein
MNWQKLSFSLIIVFIVHEVLNFLIHGLILSGIYEVMTTTWRPDMDQWMWVMYIGDLIFAFFFVFIFAKGYEGKGLMEGVRFGLIVSGIVIIPGMLAQFSVYNVTFTLTIYWIIFGIIQLVIDGIVASLIYKPLEK